MTAYQLITTTIAALLLVPTAVSATGVPSGVPDLTDAAEHFVQKEVSCYGGHASVAIRTRDSIEHVSFAPIQVDAGTDSKQSRITCDGGGYQLRGKNLTNLELTNYALATWRVARAARN